jgi:hypothetical protein
LPKLTGKGVEAVLERPFCYLIILASNWNIGFLPFKKFLLR